MNDIFSLATTLQKYGQAHLVSGIDALTPQARDVFLSRLADVDWEELQTHAHPPVMEDVRLSRVVAKGECAQRMSECTALGEKAYADGTVAILMVAGGQGTRLGSSAPKGCYQVGVHSGKSIYQIQAEKIVALSQRVGHQVPFLVMTSPMTDAETQEFFAANSGFGLAADQLRFFSQGTVPSLSVDGQALMTGPGALLENPDGHGGCFTALVKSGNLERLRKEGVQHIVYIQVDNILAIADDPLLIGLAVSEHADVVTKVLEKAHPDEKVGHLVSVGGRDHIIEYTEVTPEQCRSTNGQGELVYRWGSPALHYWSVDFLSRLSGKGYKIPLHRSMKPLKAWHNNSLVDVKGWKSERFIFDLIPEAKVSIGLEIDRTAEFAPVKNKEGADSPSTAVELASSLYKKWLQAAGVQVELPAGARIEISPVFASTQKQFLARWDGRIAKITGDYYLES